MTEAARARFPWRPLALVVAAWLVPGLGHLVQRRALRGLFFAALIAVAIVLGVTLDGNLYRPVAGQPLTALATLAAMGSGLPYFVLRYAIGYAGSPVAATYEYGTVFLLSAGLMNLLVVLEAWDLANGVGVKLEPSE